MKQLINTLEKFAAFNAKDNSLSMQGKNYASRVNVRGGYEFASNGYFMLACKSGKPETQESPDPCVILNCRPQSKTFVTVDISELEQAIKNADVFAKHSNGALVMDIRCGMAFISAKSEEFGSMTRCLTSATVSGPDLFVAMNCDYIRNTARYITDKGTVTLEFSKPNFPAFVSGPNPDKIACLMPMRIEDFEWAENGAASLYCPTLPGEKSFVRDMTPFTWDEWECKPQYRWNNDKQESELIPTSELPKVSTPTCDAVTNELVEIEFHPSKVYTGMMIAAFVAYTASDPVSDVQYGPVELDRPMDGKPTKSELMTTLNKERARIRREYKNLPATCANELRRLYRAFGNLQRKNWKETTEHAPVSDTGSLDWITLTTTRKFFTAVLATRQATQPINVTDEFKAIKKEPSHAR